MFSVNFYKVVVIGGFQCINLGHTPDFRKTRPDALTGAEKQDVSGQTRTCGNPSLPRLS